MLEYDSLAFPAVNPGALGPGQELVDGAADIAERGVANDRDVRDAEGADDEVLGLAGGQEPAGVDVPDGEDEEVVRARREALEVLLDRAPAQLPLHGQAPPQG